MGSRVSKGGVLSKDEEEGAAEMGQAMSSPGREQSYAQGPIPGRQILQL